VAGKMNILSYDAKKFFQSKWNKILCISYNYFSTIPVNKASIYKNVEHCLETGYKNAARIPLKYGQLSTKEKNSLS